MKSKYNYKNNEESISMGATRVSFNHIKEKEKSVDRSFREKNKFLLFSDVKRMLRLMKLNDTQIQLKPENCEEKVEEKKGEGFYIKKNYNLVKNLKLNNPLKNPLKSNKNISLKNKLKKLRFYTESRRENRNNAAEHSNETPQKKRNVLRSNGDVHKFEPKFLQQPIFTPKITNPLRKICKNSLSKKMRNNFNTTPQKKKPNFLEVNQNISFQNSSRLSSRSRDLRNRSFNVSFRENRLGNLNLNLASPIHIFDRRRGVSFSYRVFSPANSCCSKR